MAADQKSANTEATPMELLKQEIRHYLGAQLRHLAQKAGGRLSDATGLGRIGGGSGTLSKSDSSVRQDESPGADTAKNEATGNNEADGAEEEATDEAEDDKPGGGSGRGDQSGDTKATNIIEVIDVGVPLRFAYDHWTEFESFSGFTKGVRDAKRGEDATSDWTVKVGPSTRKWKATVQEQVPDNRILWTSEGPQGTTSGAVSFHEITPTLTRIILVFVYYPTGIVEKTGNFWRAQGRRVRLDFKHFQRYVTFAEEEAEGWRGEIRDGEIVRTHEDAMAEERSEVGEEGNEDGEEFEEDGEDEADFEDEDDEAA